jgi:hypothetical protein
MKKTIYLLALCFILQGCSVIKWVSSPFKNSVSSVPQSTEQSKNKVVCKGEYQTDENGNIIYCSKGYYNYSQDSSVKERKLTIKERIVQFVDKFFGWTIVIAIVLLVVAPGTLVSILSYIIAKQKKIMVQIIQGVQDARKRNIELNIALASAMDTDAKQEVVKIKEQEKIR